MQSSVLEASRRTMLPRSGRPADVNGDEIETLNENNRCCIMQGRADILKIAKSIKLLVEMKNVSFILWGKKT